MPTPSPRCSSLAMRTGRIATCMVAAALFSACASAPASKTTAAATEACESGWTMADYAAARVVHKIRLFTDPTTGDSAMEETTYAPKSTPLLKTGTILREYDFGPASKTQIVAGPADLDIPLHPAPYRESFMVLKGSVVMRLGSGQERVLLPGDMITTEDTNASRGHGGRTGPCGYVSLNIVP